LLSKNEKNFKWTLVKLNLRWQFATIYEFFLPQKMHLIKVFKKLKIQDISSNQKKPHLKVN